MIHVHYIKSLHNFFFFFLLFLKRRYFLPKTYSTQFIYIGIKKVYLRTLSKEALHPISQNWSEIWEILIYCLCSTKVHRIPHATVCIAIGHMPSLSRQPFIPDNFEVRIVVKRKLMTPYIIFSFHMNVFMTLFGWGSKSITCI